MTDTKPAVSPEEAKKREEINVLLSKALTFGAKAHHGQKDDNGKDYFQTHCLQVLQILTHLTKDTDVWVAAILHDTIEDTDVTYEKIKEEFGEVVADLVNELTHEGDKDTGYIFPRLHSRSAIIIKFADRLSNLTRMDAWDDKRIEHYLKRSKFWKSENDAAKSATK